MSDRPNPARELADSGTPGPWRITQRDTGNWSWDEYPQGASDE